MRKIESQKYIYLKQGIVDEDVLILSLDHVVPLGPQTRHVTIHVHLAMFTVYTFIKQQDNAFRAPTTLKLLLKIA